MSLIFDSSRVDDTPQYGLGELTFDETGKAFVYVKASAAISTGRMAAIDRLYTAKASPSNTASGLYGLANHAIAKDKFSWLQRLGPSPALQVAANCAAFVQLYTDSPAGQLDDDASSQKAIRGVWITSARSASAGPAPCMLNWPASL